MFVGCTRNLFVLFSILTFLTSFSWTSSWLGMLDSRSCSLELMSLLLIFLLNTQLLLKNLLLNTLDNFNILCQPAYFR